MFGSENPIRVCLFHLSSNWLFETVVILLIVASTVILAFEHPMEDPNSDMVAQLRKIDLVITICFVVEALVKITVMGFLANGSNSYLLNSWNLFDFLILLLTAMSFVVDSRKFAIVKNFRILRILRPIRLINHSAHLNIAIKALFKAIPNIMRLQVVVLFVMLMMSILMTSLLSGQLSSCELGHTTLSTPQ